MKYLLPLLLLAGFVLNSTTVGGQTVSEQLRGKSGQEKAQIKSSAIGQIDHSGVFVDNNYGLIIEIVGALEQIEVDGQAGVQLFARAWKNGKRVGFLDGTVEIERFRIFNPPILVNDPVGSITREYVGKDGVVKVRRLREDPKEAIRQSLAHIINVTHTNGDKVISGKRGNTTSTFYPDGNPESTTVDGRAYQNPGSTTWSTAHDATAGNGASDADTRENNVYTAKSGANYLIHRYFALFDTSAIPDTDTISASTLSVYKYNGDPNPVANADSTTVEIVQTNPASNTAIVAADYDALTFASGGSKTLASWGDAEEYKDITMDATGRSWVSKTTITKLGLITGLDLSNTAPTGENGPNQFYGADQTGTANDPKLVVVHAAPVATFSPHQMFPF